MKRKKISVKKALEMGYEYGVSDDSGSNPYFDLSDLDENSRCIVLDKEAVYPELNLPDLVNLISDFFNEYVYDVFGEVVGDNYESEDLIFGNANFLKEFIKEVNKDIVGLNFPSYELSEYVAVKE